jgi:excisionase family DNA binding protein
MSDTLTVSLSRESLVQLAEILRGENPQTQPIESDNGIDVLYLSIAKSAKRIDVSQDSIRRMIDSGELKAKKFGGSIRIKISDLDRAGKPIKGGAS